MLDQYFHRQRVLERIERNLLGDHLGLLAQHLHRRGQTANTVRAYLQATEHFGHWLSRGRHALEDVDARLVEVFIVRHLPRCRCPVPHSRAVATVRASLHQLLAVMPHPTAAAAPTPIDEITRRLLVNARKRRNLRRADLGADAGMRGNLRRVRGLGDRDQAADFLARRAFLSVSASRRR